MKSEKWLFILLALCLVFSVTPARAFAGQTVSQTADQVQEKTVEKTVFEEISDTLAQAQGEPDEDALAQAQEEPEKDTRSILLHIPFVCAVMILLLAVFIIWGKRQESKEM